MSAIGETTSGLDIGRVIQETFAVLGRNFLTFLVLALLLTGLPAVVLGFVQQDTLRSGLAVGAASGIWTSVLGGLVGALTGLILQGMIIYGTVSDLNGKPASIADSLRVGLYAFLPMLLLGIMMGIAVALASILLLVPGIMLAIAWCVVIPVYVVERPNIMDCFGRSAQLTRGSRWSIFGLAVLYVIVVIIIEMVLLGVFGGLLRVAITSGSVLAIRVVVVPLIGVFNALIGTTGGAVLYVELRRIRDGVGPAGLAAIFD